jgi:hypothetical protein
MPAELTPGPPLEHLADIKADLDRISSWPWSVGNAYGGVVNPRGTTYSAYDDEGGHERGTGWRSATEAYGGELICESVAGENRKFIAAAPGRIARLLAEVDRYRALVEGLTAGADVLCLACTQALQGGRDDHYPPGSVLVYEGRTLCIQHFTAGRQRSYPTGDT